MNVKTTLRISNISQRAESQIQIVHNTLDSCACRYQRASQWLEHNALLFPSNPTMNQNAKENMSATRCSLIRHPQHYQHLYAAAFHLMSHSTCRNSTTEEQRPVSSKFQPREIPDSPIFTLKISRLSLNFFHFSLCSKSTRSISPHRSVSTLTASMRPALSTA